MAMLIVVVMFLILSSITTSNGWVECEEDKRIVMYEQFRNCTDEQYHIFHEQQCSNDLSEHSSKHLCPLLLNLVDKCGQVWKLCHDSLEVKDIQDRQVIALINNFGDHDIEQCNIIQQFSAAQPFRKLDKCSEIERIKIHRDFEHCSYSLSSNMNDRLQERTEEIQPSRLICDNLKKIEITCLDKLTNCYSRSDSELLLKSHIDEMRTFFVRYINSIMPNITSLDCEVNDKSENMEGSKGNFNIFVDTTKQIYDAESRTKKEEKQLTVTNNTESSRIIGNVNEIIFNREKENKAEDIEGTTSVYVLDGNTIEMNLISNIEYDQTKFMGTGSSGETDNIKADFVPDVDQNQVISHFEHTSSEIVELNSIDEQQLNIILEGMHINMTNNNILIHTENIPINAEDYENINHQEEDHIILEKVFSPAKNLNDSTLVKNMSFMYENPLDDHEEEKTKLEEVSLKLNNLHSESKYMRDENKTEDNNSEIKIMNGGDTYISFVKPTQINNEIKKGQVREIHKDQEYIGTNSLNFPPSKSWTGVINVNVQVQDKENLKPESKDKHPQIRAKQESIEIKKLIIGNRENFQNIEFTDKIIQGRDKNQEAQYTDVSTRIDFQEGNSIQANIESSPKGHRYPDKNLNQQNTVVNTLAIQEYPQVEEKHKQWTEEELGLTLNISMGSGPITEEDHQENSTEISISETKNMNNSNKNKNKIKLLDIIHDIFASSGIESEESSDRTSLNNSVAKRTKADLQYGWTLWSTKVHNSMSENIKSSKYFNNSPQNFEGKSKGENNMGSTISLPSNVVIYLFLYIKLYMS